MREDEISDDPCEVCIVGAGIAGLNALIVASGYLTTADRVVLVDARSRVGGMWVDTYDYVRLHQPHGIFTAGDIAWQLRREPSHLATKTEVLDHLQYCLEVARTRVALEERYGWEYVAHEEVDGGVRVQFSAPDGSTRTVRAKRLIKAFGHQVTANAPLSSTSDRVRSTTPELLDLGSDDVRSGDAPFWVVGGGKTAMDTAHRLITELPGRSVNLLAGPGTFFARRDTFFPTGSRRWWSGTMINTMLREVGQRFDGTNEDEVRAWYRPTYGISPTPEATDFFSAYLSEQENEVISNGLEQVENEYFVDATDRGDGAELVLRSGRTVAVPAGAWVVNCTGSLLRTSPAYEPFVSAAGTTLSIQMRSSATGVFSSFAGYYLTHLFFTDKLGSAGLYELDVADLHSKEKSVVFYASVSLALHNLSVIADSVHPRVMMGCGLDFDRWYPPHRRLIGLQRFVRHHRQDREHHRRTLDTLGERFDVRSGPLVREPAR